ncbi:MAG: DUF433 domain-containing protein [Salinibacter sp.]
MTTLKTQHPHVVRKEGVQGGSPIIAGTRVPVTTIVLWYKQGKNVDEILELYPHLTPAQVYDALSYYHDHQTEMEEELASIQNEAQWQATYPPGLGQPRRSTADVCRLT